LLCSLHHSYVHEHRYQITQSETGTLRFLDPSGNPVLSVPPRPSPQALGWPAIRAAKTPISLSPRRPVVTDGAATALIIAPQSTHCSSFHRPQQPPPGPSTRTRATKISQIPTTTLSLPATAPTTCCAGPSRNSTPPAPIL
jgi:hypothetical protein